MFHKNCYHRFKLSILLGSVLWVTLLSLVGCKTVPISVLTRAVLEIHVIDVGYGESLLLKTPTQRFMLWDGGYPEKGPIVCDYLSQQGVRHLDLIVNSHPHPDHIGGLSTVLSHFSVTEIWGSHALDFPEIPNDFREMVSETQTPYKIVRRGHTWQWTDQIALEILHPVQLVPDLNDSSLVCRLSFGRTIILLTADIGPAAQQELLSNFGSSLRSTFMTVPHHGGISHLPFFKIVNPDLISLSVGENPWGNPKAQTLEFLKNMGLTIKRTDELGSLVFRCDDEGKINPAYPDQNTASQVDK
ncbi:ComEC/Rec2 family competence protein [candidate division CSSED10-310 bacterium]|uniref:ComEC/Rec2 family competence protein n=1 Tax=candidate division CSSED10-310 bacterium TaxID=2855610 RepID=A0ABV6Z3W1_UNCC1